MINIKEAQKIIIQNFNFSKIGEIDILNSLDYILAEDISSPDFLPRFTNSAMDGFAIKTNKKRGSLKFKIIGKINAGDDPKNLKINEFETVEISTGAPIPEGADAVIPKEDVEIENGFIKVNREVKVWENIRFKGEDVKKGEKILKKGDLITPEKIGLLASLGIKKVKVFLKPEVGIITTGSEIKEINEKIEEFQIRDSNKFILKAFLKKIGIEPVFVRTFKDEKGKILSFLKGLKKTPDIIILSGGVSVGKRDFVKDEIRDFGAKELFWRVNQKPGKPIFAALKNKTIFFGLPGNPGALIVCFYLYILPAINKFIGNKKYFLKEGVGILDKDLKNKGERTLILNCFYKNGRLNVLKEQGSHRIFSFSKANSFLILKPKKKLRKGEEVKFLIL